MRLLVRHAHAGHKRHRSGPDAGPPLGIRGWRRPKGSSTPWPTSGSSGR